MKLVTIALLFAISGATAAWGAEATPTDLAGVPLNETLDPAKVAEYCEREPWILTPVEGAPRGGKFGFIPARYLYQAAQAEKAGDAEKAAAYKQAARDAGRLYHKQLQASLGYLQTRMDRHEIGAYAQNLWENITMVVEVKNGSLTGFIPREKLNQMDDEMKELARDRVYMNTKWLALNINELASK